jgi:hypothetical protein
MPIHDWSKVDSGMFHNFHQIWSVELSKTLNRGVLPKGYFAYIEQKVPIIEPDVIAVVMGDRKAKGAGNDGNGGIALAPPRTKRIQTLESDNATYARKANRLTVRNRWGKPVAVIEIVSPGNKDSKKAIRDFIDKSAGFLRAGIHLLILDLFRPTKRDPGGIHKAIFDELGDFPDEEPSDKPFTFVSYDASDPIVAYIEPVGIGDPLPEMPLYLARDFYVMLPLKPSYDEAVLSSTEPVIRELEASVKPKRPRRK